MKWTKELIFNESKKYTSRVDFFRGSRNAYDAAARQHLLDEMTWLIPKKHNHWTKEDVFEESKKYTSKSDFKKGSQLAYHIACENQWIAEMDWLMPQYNSWSKEKVFLESRKYSSRIEFEKNSISAYCIACKHQWLDDMTWLKKRTLNTWDYDSVIEESKKYHSRKEFEEGSSCAYNKANKNNWLKDMTWLKPQVNPYIDNIYFVYGYFDFENKVTYIGLTMDCESRHQEHCKKGPVYRYFKGKVPTPLYLESNLYATEAQEKEEYYITHYKSINWKILNKAKTGIGTSSLGSIIKWTKPKVIEFANKCKSRKEFHDKYHGAYSAAIRFNWIDELFDSKHRTWDIDNIIEESKKYHNRSSFRKYNYYAYKLACKNNLLNKMTWLDKKNNSK